MNSLVSASSYVSEIEQLLPLELNLRKTSLFQQPIVAAANHADIAALEILCRPKDLHPLVFFKMAQNFQCMPLVDQWIFSKVLIEAMALLEQGQHIWINLSPQTLLNEKAIERFTLLLSLLPDPGLIGFELTEDEIITDMRRAVEHASRLREAGAKFILDDFGAGGANICLLLEMPYDVVKLDKSVFHRTCKEPRYKRLLSGLCDEIRQYGKRVVAEGVEDPGMAAEAIALGCELVQGYFIERPSPLTTRLQLSQWVNAVEAVNR